MKFKLLNESINVPHNAKLCGELTDEELNILAQQIVEDCIEERRDAYSIEVITDRRDADDWDEVECDVHLYDWEIKKGYGKEYNSELSDFEIDTQEDADGSYRAIPNQVNVFVTVDGCDINGDDYLIFDPFTDGIGDDLEVSEFIENSKKRILRELDDLDFDEIDVTYYGDFDFAESLKEELIKPKKDEDKQSFIDRFMSDDLSKEEFPDNKQRFAVCMSIWSKNKKN